MPQLKRVHAPREVRDRASIGLMVAALSLVPSFASAQPLFQPRIDYPAGYYPNSIAVADFNEDGWPDLVVGNFYTSTISTLFNRRDGTFAAPISLDAGSEAGAVAVSDIDGDGHIDLVCTRAGAQKVTLLMGNGDGTFRAGVSHGVGVGPCGVGIADFNHDGRQDLAVVNAGTHACCWTASLLFASLDGFAPQTKLTLSRDPVAIAACDLNSDGNPDLVVASGAVVAMLGNGDGTFGLAINFAPGRSLAIGDVNGDGHPDILAGVNPGFYVHLGVGDGTLAAPRYFGGGTTRAITLGDVDGDGHLDAAITDWDSDSASVFLGDGQGSFGSRIGLPAGNRCLTPALADLNRDGRLDLVVTNALSNSVSVFLGQPQSTSVGPDAGLGSELEGARPDPFVTGTRIAYRLAHGGRVRLSVFDLRGRELSVLEDAHRAAGSYAVSWEGRDRGGDAVPPGVYFVRLRLPEGGERVERVVRLR
jgi:hypothetical protein